MATRSSGSTGAGLLAKCSAGILVAIWTASFSLSYAALLFAGTSAQSQSTGLAMLLTTSIVLALVGGILCTIRFSVLSADGTVVAVAAAGTAGIVADMAGAPEHSVAATLVMGLMLAAITTGTCLFLIGSLRAGRVARYVPFQVMAGFLATTGWSLSIGGLAVATNQSVAPSLLADPDGLLKSLPAAVTAAALLAAAARSRNPVILPAVIIAAIMLHHLCFWMLGWSLADQRAGGWLLTLPPTLSWEVPWSPGMLAAVDWPVLGDHAGTLFALIPITAIALLLGISGIEMATGQDVALDREVKVNGIAAIASGTLGGIVGFTSFSRSLLIYNLGVRGWGPGVVAGLASGLIPMAWPGLLAMIPRSVLGALLLFSGLGLLRQWVVHSRRRLALSEWLTVLAVVAISARFGLLIGVFAGLLLGCVAFAVLYSKGSPIRARYRGDVARSSVDRSEPEQNILTRHADSLLVLHLQGFVFFGTASRLLGEVKDEIASSSGMLRFLVLDFCNVDGLDGSALSCFERLSTVAARDGIQILLTGLSPAIRDRLAQAPAVHVRIEPTLDDALEYWEVSVRDEFPAPDALPAAEILSEFGAGADLDLLRQVLRTELVPAGAMLTRQGEISDHLMVLESGRASVLVSFGSLPPMRVRSFGAGSLIGEIGFFLGQPRTATVRTDEPCRVLTLTRDAMDRLEAEHPAVAMTVQRAIIRRLSTRLLDKDQLIASLVRDRSTAGNRE